MQRPVRASFSKSSKILRVMKSISRLSKLGGLTLLGNSSWLPYSTYFIWIFLCFMTNTNMKNTAGKSLAHSFFSSAMFRALIYCNMAHYSLLRDPLENIWYMIWRHLFDPWRHPFWPLVQNGPTVLSTFGGILINLTAPNCTKVLF